MSETAEAEGAVGAVAVDVVPQVRADTLVDARSQDVAVPAVGARIVSLDAVRGLMLIVSVGVNSWYTMPAWFDHAQWIGIHPLDWVFPTFVTLSGCGLAFANARRVRPRPIIQRAIILFAVGLVYNWIGSSAGFSISFGSIRLTGVLQLYAFVVLIIAALHLVVKDWRQWAVVTLVLALADASIIGFWGSSCAAGHVTTMCNPSHVIDYAVYGAQHLLNAGHWGYDPEGLVGIIGSLVSASLGATVGHALLSSRGEPRRWPLVVTIGSIALGGLVLANLLDLAVPGFKKQWTAPFALLVSSITAVALLAGHLAVDGPRATRLQGRLIWPLVALGRNSLLVYFGSHALMALLLTHGVPLWVTYLEGRVTMFGHPQLSLIVVLEAFWISLACMLHWRRIYLRP